MNKNNGWTKHAEHNGQVYLNREIRFGVKDQKGREMGVDAMVHFSQSVWTGEKAEVRHGFWSSVQATRDGAPFGAGFPIRHEHPTLEAAQADALKRAEVSRKKVARKAAKTGGVYK